MRRRLGPLALLLVLVGCAGAPEQQTSARPEAAGQTLEERSELGPVAVTVRLWPAEPRLGDPLTLELEVEAEAGVELELPAFGEALGRFSIVDFTPRSETRPDGRQLASQRYTLQPPMSGRQRVPPLRVAFLDRRPGQSGEPEWRELLSEELAIEVASVLPEGAVSEELRPARERLPLRRPARWLAALVLVLTLGAAAGAIMWWRSHARERARASAYDVALRRLERLERRGLPDAAAADAWYVELSDIVRHYLEDRYGVRAPELTTEEFLREARRSSELRPDHRELLSHFLERCDRVKFAAYTPAESESREALEVARRFLSETRLEPTQARARKVA